MTGKIEAVVINGESHFLTAEALIKKVYNVTREILNESKKKENDDHIGTIENLVYLLSLHSETRDIIPLIPGEEYILEKPMMPFGYHPTDIRDFDVNGGVYQKIDFVALLLHPHLVLER